MHPHTFDAFVRVLARGQSRRDLGRLAAASVAGGLLAATGTARVAADDGCGNEGDSCQDQSCCDGLACSQDSVCFIPDADSASCGYEGDSCQYQSCCDGVACSQDLVCFIPDSGATSCGYAGDSCQYQACCDGIACSQDLVCFVPDPDAATCGYEGESCENQVCCDPWVCSASLACVAPSAVCGYEGESCENQPCCDGLTCNNSLACVIPDEGVATCGNVGDSCADQPCCGGLACSQDSVCFIPDSGASCNGPGESCETYPCCDNLVCNGSLVCVEPNSTGNPNQGTAGNGNASNGTGEGVKAKTPTAEGSNNSQQTAAQATKPASVASAPTSTPVAAGNASGFPATWLDGDRQPWNKVGVAIPTAPKAAAASGSCAPTVRKPETAGDRQLAAAGWQLVGGYTAGFGVSVIRAAQGLDANCRPMNFQWFVFVDGAFAGTLSPDLMQSRTDGAVSHVELARPDEIGVEYVRYRPSDVLCCPSRVDGVVFGIERTTDGPVVTPEPA